MTTNLDTTGTEFGYAGAMARTLSGYLEAGADGVDNNPYKAAAATGLLLAATAYMQSENIDKLSGGRLSAFATRTKAFAWDWTPEAVKKDLESLGNQWANFKAGVSNLPTAAYNALPAKVQAYVPARFAPQPIPDANTVVVPLNAAVTPPPQTEESYSLLSYFNPLSYFYTKKKVDDKAATAAENNNNNNNNSSSPVTTTTTITPSSPNSTTLKHT